MGNYMPKMSSRAFYVYCKHDDDSTTTKYL